MHLRISPAAPALLLFLAAGSVTAQGQEAQAPRPPRVACRASALSLCRPEAKSGDRAAIRACLIRNFDKVSPECQASMKAARANGEDKPDAAAPKP